MLADVPGRVAFAEVQAANAEAEAKQQEEQAVRDRASTLEARRIRMAGMVEPAPGGEPGTVARILVRTPPSWDVSSLTPGGGGRITRRFLVTDMLQALFDWVDLAGEVCIGVTWSACTRGCALPDNFCPDAGRGGRYWTGCGAHGAGGG